MPKLYYTATSCGAASFLAAHVAGVNIEAEQVNIYTHVTDSGANFYEINPKGNVPTVVLDDGTVLNENAATLQFIGDLDSTHSILPAAGTSARYEVIAALSYVGTEYHKAVGPLFNPTISDDVRAYVLANLNSKLAYLNDKVFNTRTFWVGEKLSVADLYLYICLSWSGYLKLDLSPYPNVVAFQERVGAIPAVQAGHARIATNPAHTL